jgi:hypothetical protein
MKYFDQLPKRNFETTNGTYTISDFFSYYKFNFDLVSKKEFEFDSKTTLVEAASKLYEDPNSFWLLLLANNWINPFTLLEDNSTEFNKKNQEKYVTTLGLHSGTTGFYMSAGSIILPYAPTGGNPYDYSYIGNFDLDGPVYIVEDQDSYTKKVTIKPALTGMSGYDTIPSWEQQYIDYKSSTGYIVSTTANIESKASQKYLQADEVIQYSNVSNTISFRNMAVADVPNVYNPIAGQPATTQYTKEEAVVIVNKKINTFVPSELSKVTRNLITVKYT